MTMRVSIVTVCFNSERTIERCINSILKLGVKPYEYLVIDGASTDSTLSILNSYINIFEKAEIKYTIVSETDTGIYNAMNKAIDIAQGDWVIYLNSDDYFCSENILDFAVCEKEEIIKSEIIYGNVIVRDKDNKYYRKPEPIEMLKSGYMMPFCHQCTFTKLILLKQYRFNESYRIIGDIDLCLRMYEDGRKFRYIYKYISVFSNDGLSQTNRLESINEGIRMLKEHNIYHGIRKYKILIYKLWYALRTLTPFKEIIYFIKH